MDEVWKEIPGYEGNYFISSLGRIKNRHGQILKPMTCTNGYLSACLWLHNRQSKKLVHRLVAQAFIRNDHDYTEVNHIDEDKTNNAVSNLEWCTHAYNMNYGFIKEKISRSHKGKCLTPEHRMKCASATGKKWVNNGMIEMLVVKADVPSYLLQGYQIGRLKHYVREGQPQAC